MIWMMLMVGMMRMMVEMVWMKNEMMDATQLGRSLVDIGYLGPWKSLVYF